MYTIMQASNMLYISMQGGKRKNTPYIIYNRKEKDFYKNS